MNKYLVGMALTLMCANVFASKAKVEALGSLNYAVHLVDSQSIFENPSHILSLSDYATVEYGFTPYFNPAGTPTGYPAGIMQVATPTAEGGFIKSSNDAKYGIYLGHHSRSSALFRSLYGMLFDENPITLFYGKKAATPWSASFDYSASNKATSGKQNSMSMTIGADTDQWEASAIIGLGGSATGSAARSAYSAGMIAALGDYGGFASNLGAIAADPDAKYTPTAGYQLRGVYKMDDWRPYARYGAVGAKYESSLAGNSTANDTKFGLTQMALGAVNVLKVEGGQFFWGFAYETWSLKESKLDYKKERVNFPVYLGLEYQATEWMSLRASARQNVLIGSVKEGTGDSQTKENDTVVNAGAGFKMGKWNLDAVLAGLSGSSAAGKLNTTDLFANASMTYNF